MPTVRCPEHFGGLLRCRLRAPCTAGSGACRSARRPISVLDRQAPPPAATTGWRSNARYAHRWHGGGRAGLASTDIGRRAAKPARSPPRARPSRSTNHVAVSGQPSTDTRSASAPSARHTLSIERNSVSGVQAAACRVRAAWPAWPYSAGGSGAGISTSMARSSAAVARARLRAARRPGRRPAPGAGAAAGGTPPRRAACAEAVDGRGQRAVQFRGVALDGRRHRGRAARRRARRAGARRRRAAASSASAGVCAAPAASG